MLIGDTASVAFPEALDLTETVAPRRDLLATFALEPNIRENARVDGDEAAVSSDVPASEDLGFCSRRDVRKTEFRNNLDLVVAVFAIRVGVNATIYEACS